MDSSPIFWTFLRHKREKNPHKDIRTLRWGELRGCLSDGLSERQEG